MPSEAQDHTAKSGTPEPLRLTFPDLPRLELDQLLGQLVERAQEVLATQGRLRGLLRASQLVGADLTLPAVLRRIVEAARELVGARYAALGVIFPAGDLAEFVHSGMADEDVARIGHLPQGKGLLGALIEAPEPILLRRITDDPRSSGFPEGHPPMHSFLGVPIRIRNEVFGNLYLTESSNGPVQLRGRGARRGARGHRRRGDRQCPALRIGPYARKMAPGLCRHHAAVAGRRRRRQPSAGARRRALPLELPMRTS